MATPMFITTARVIMLSIFAIFRSCLLIFYAALKKLNWDIPETIPYADAITNIPINKYCSIFFAFPVSSSSPRDFRKYIPTKSNAISARAIDNCRIVFIMSAIPVSIVMFGSFLIVLKSEYFVVSPGRGVSASRLG